MTSDEMPLFEVPTQPVLSDVPTIAPLLDQVLAELSDVVGAVRADQLSEPTPCADFDVRTLRDHIVGWVQFFAAALADPDGGGQRIDPAAYHADDDERNLADVVTGCAATIHDAVEGGVVSRTVAMSQSRMHGPAVMGMLLGEYVVHGWDLAAATGRPWTPPDAACETSLAFFQGMIQPAYRGPDSGFFLAEIQVPDDASPLERLLGFAGRDPAWKG